MWFIYWILVGAILGSFTNMLAWRLPKQEPWVYSRSYCPKCGHQLATLDLIPIVSYVALGEKCRYCHEPISPRYFIVELTSAALWGCVPLINNVFGLRYTIAWCLFVFFGLLASTIDWEHREIPSALLDILLVGTGVLCWFNWRQALFLGCIWGLFYLLSPFVLGKQGMGDGDVWFALTVGFILMPNEIMTSAIYMFTTGVVGILFSIIYAVITHNKLDKLEVPFLPAMWVAAIVIILIQLIY